MNNATDIIQKGLVIYKSDKHTFEELVETIWIGTGNTPIQCEQLALLINSKGYATVKVADIDEIKPMAETIQLDGFRVEIV